MYGRGAAAGGEIQNTCLLQAAFKNRGPTHRQVGTVTEAEVWEGVLGLLIKVFRSKAGPLRMVQPANWLILAYQMLDRADILTINFSALDQTQKMGPYFWKASLRM